VVAGTAGGASAATPTITAPSSGAASTPIVISGAGWAPYETTIYVYLVLNATSTYACSLSANGGGTVVPQACTMPSNLIGGSYTLQVKDTTNTVNKAFTLNASITVSSYFNGSAGSHTATTAAGDELSISGYGFKSNITSVKFGSTAVTPSSKTVSSGGWTATITVPAASAAGTDTITVTGGNSATWTIRVYKASLTFPASGGSGGPFAISGSGWPANDYIRISLYITLFSASVCTVTSSSTGVIPAQTCNVPTNLPATSYNVTAVDGNNDVNLTYSKSSSGFVMHPSITLFSANVSYSSTVVSTGAAGQSINVGGSGFLSGGTVKKVEFDTTTVPFKPNPMPMSSDGAFNNSSTSNELTVVIPANATAGRHTITVFDNAPKPNQASATVQVYKATLTASATVNGAATTTATAGDPIVLSGTGWPGGEYLSAYLITGTATNPTLVGSVNNCLNNLETNSNGVLPATSCTVPDILGGTAKYTLEMVDGPRAVVATVPKFTITASLDLLTNYAQQPASTVGEGDTLDFYAYGLTGNFNEVTIGGTKVALSGTTVVSPTGTLGLASFTVPSTLKAGPTTVTLTYASSKLTVSANITVYKPTLSLGAPSGPAAQTVLVTGSGWPALDSISVNLVTGSSSNGICTVYTDSTGTVIPQSCTSPSYAPGGSYTLTAYDSYEAVEFTAPYKLTPSIEITTNGSTPAVSAGPGTSLDMDGWGFGNGVTVTSLKFGTHSVPFSTTTNVYGQIPTAGFTVPSIASGTYTVTVTDSANNKATTSFTIT